MSKKTNAFSDELVTATLNLKFKKKDEDSGAKSVREYLQKLLSTLWDEGEGFSGKRPFGNSSWEYDIYRELIRAKLITGSLDEYGGVDEFDEDEAHELMQCVIAKAFAA